MTAPDTGDAQAPIRYTVTVRRGLKLMAQMIRTTEDPNIPSVEAQVLRLTGEPKRDLERALAWIGTDVLDGPFGFCPQSFPFSDIGT